MNSDSEDEELDNSVYEPEDELSSREEQDEYDTDPSSDGEAGTSNAAKFCLGCRATPGPEQIIVSMCK